MRELKLTVARLQTREIARGTEEEMVLGGGAPNARSFDKIQANAGRERERAGIVRCAAKHHLFSSGKQVLEAQPGKSYF